MRKKFVLCEANGNGYLMFPVDNHLQIKINKHMKEFNEPTGPCFFQEIYNVSEAFPDKSRQIKELSKGWKITIILDPWEALHCWGYDCHTICE